MQQTTCRVPAKGPARGRRDAGFSLLELMVVVVILSILALVVVPRVRSQVDRLRGDEDSA